MLLYYNRGLAWHDKKEYDKAIAHFSQVIRIDPNRVDAYYGRGLVWEDKKAYDKAIADYDEALARAPKTLTVSTPTSRLSATCPDSKFRNGKKAVESGLRACELTEWKDATYLIPSQPHTPRPANSTKPSTARPRRWVAHRRERKSRLRHPAQALPREEAVPADDSLSSSRCSTTC